METWKIAGINFDHMHMGDLLRLAHEHPKAEIVGICDDDLARMQGAARSFGIGEERQFTDYRECLERTQPDIVLLCPATGRHGEYVEKVAPFGVHILVEKPFAASLTDADAMIRAVEATGKTMVVNWPLAWYPPHITTKRLIDEGVIGDVLEVHYYDGNRGPLRHIADKIEITAQEAARQKSLSWWYQKESGGGSLLDYLGYGVTLGTWFHNGRAPIEVTCVVDEPPGLEVDEHSITIARYDFGLSKYETRWGTFSDPWTLQPQPKCGFVVVGTAGTISSYDYEQTIRLQTKDRPEGRDIPVDAVEAPRRNPIEYLIHCLATGEAVTGPLSPQLSRIGQQIVDTAVVSAREKRTVPLLGVNQRQEYETVVVTLDPELEARLRALAAARGEDPNRYATALLTEALERDEDPDAGLTEKEKAAIQAGVERGLADSVAGRVKPADEFYAEMNRKYSLPR